MQRSDMDADADQVPTDQSDEEAKAAIDEIGSDGDWGSSE